jgi:hypothetical protein
VLEVCTKEKKVKNSKMERMQRKVNINICEKCALKKKKHKNTRMKECNEKLATSTTRSAE